MQNCYNTKKTTRGEAEDVDERLTTKHIQTLSFLQEIVNENKALKARVAELEVFFSVFTMHYVHSEYHIDLRRSCTGPIHSYCAR